MLCIWVRSVSTKVQQSVLCVYNAIGVYRIDAYVSVYTRLQSSRVALVRPMPSGRYESYAVVSGAKASIPCVAPRVVSGTSAQGSALKASRVAYVRTKLSGINCFYLFGPVST